ncbi:hypothetical protein PV05_10557 [Exophiala xenobiotica]|uniref:Palmitoyltransferase n=1 Tax=Exophiala xenobiotica TaxID=348802 RepID=A0A0D2BHU3_9EURO|nr:uncharacterized protein PV05_10557 [Exophiala xenobiotica]KIW51876.1 hypothetical protein PV05_10557 [Exophiala xenobiotica]
MKINGMRPGEKNKRGNIVTARIVPLLLLGIIGYSSYVVTKKICLDYLIHPQPSLFVRHHTGTAIAILTIYYLLLLIALTCLTRLIQTITTNPGLVPRGAQYFIEKERTRQNASTPSHKEEPLEHESTEGYTPRRHRLKHDSGYPAQNFWRKDIFICGWDGRPPFCSTCYNYKPDRAHHCSELGRCVLKMDHFCPWVGGIVSETSFKYFIQFTFWAALFCLHTLVVVSYYFAQRRQRESGGFFNVHWILVLIFAALFFVFSAGMCGSSLQFAFLNSSTIENFTRKTKVWYLAVYVPKTVLDRYQSSGRSDWRLISYPRPASEQFEILEQNGARLSDSQRTMTSPGTEPSAPQAVYDPQRSQFPPHPAIAREGIPSTTEQQGAASSPSSTPTAIPSEEARTFVILETPPGANPFDIGPLGNFKEVMGYTVFDWLFPLLASPSVDHSDPRSMYKMGPVVDRLAREAGLSIPSEDMDRSWCPNREPESEREDVNENEKEGNITRTGRHKRKRRRRRSTAFAEEEGIGTTGDSDQAGSR